MIHKNFIHIKTLVYNFLFQVIDILIQRAYFQVIVLDEQRAEQNDEDRQMAVRSSARSFSSTIGLSLRAALDTSVSQSGTQFSCANGVQPEGF